MTALKTGEFDAWLEGMRLALDEVQRRRIASYLSDLREHAVNVNLTADEGEAVWLRRHVADGLAALPVLRRRLAGLSPRILDLGAGAGFVGVTLKIAWPEASVTLLESSYKKFQFLNWACARLGLRGLHVLWKRAGQAPSEGEFDAVTARAVAPLPAIVRTALPSARRGGVFCAFSSAAPSAEEPALRRALEAAGGSLLEVAAYRLPAEERDRHLVVIGRNP